MAVEIINRPARLEVNFESDGSIGVATLFTTDFVYEDDKLRGPLFGPSHRVTTDGRDDSMSMQDIIDLIARAQKAGA